MFGAMRLLRLGGRRLLAAGLVLAVLGLTGGATSAAEGKLRALSTIGMLGDLVARIVGETATAETLLGPGVDPHLYKLTRADVRRLLAADIVFYNGLFLEGKMADAMERAASAGRPVLAAAETLPKSYLLAPAEFAGAFDPHVWMDVSGWAQVAEAVCASLSDFAPELAPLFAVNARQLDSELERLDTYAREVLSTVPAEKRVLVTAHDAFSYFGRAYGFEVIGIQGISTESEAGLRRIQEIVDLLVARQIPAVFVETTVSDRNVRALIEGVAARGHEVVIGGSLYSDAMGEPGTYEGTYVGMIDHNVTTIARALGGEVPERGMNGELAVARN